MQAVMENLCRCFGSSPLMNAGGDDLMMEDHQIADADDGKRRRTRSLALQDTQWDALFSLEQHPRTPNHRRNMEQEEAQAVSKAKLAANPLKNSPSSSSKGRGGRGPKRKRCTRDDIFRSKKMDRQHAAAVHGGSTTPGYCGTQPNPLSRFLSNHPVIAQTLCFATPVKDSTEEEAVIEERNSMNSVVSDTNTLNTAEDTITSTLYYENTRLAGMSQKNPPMPLFNNFAVDERDDIHQIVATNSHLSSKHNKQFKEYHQAYYNRSTSYRDQSFVNDCFEVVDYDSAATAMDGSSNRGRHRKPQQWQIRAYPQSPPQRPRHTHERRQQQQEEDDAVPPAMTPSSSGSSNRSADGR